MSRENMVYIGRLSSKVRKEDLQDEFEKFGKIKDVNLRRNHAFVEFETPE